MGRCRVVVPDTVRIPISDGDWIEVIRQPSYGDIKAMQSIAIKSFDGLVVKPDVEVLEIAQAIGYLVGWSLVDLDGRPIAIDTIAAKKTALFDQDPATVKEIIAAVSAHAEQMEAEKNAKAGASASSATLPSAV